MTTREKLSRAKWITWERHQRSRSLTAALNISLVELSQKRSRVFRYVWNSILTLLAVVRHRPRVLFVQVPSVVLGCLAIVISVVARFRVVVDAHNAVLENAAKAKYPLRALYKFVLRRADLVIVTNTALAERVEKLGGLACVLPDPVPPFQANDAGFVSSSTVVVVSTWAEDEPLAAILQAAKLLPITLSLTITGRPRGAHAQAAKQSPRVTVTGYLSDDDYVELLRNARVIVDLTTREDCLVCGAYEALALGRPLVVSDSRALRGLLLDGAIYTRNESEDIASAIIAASEQESVMSKRCAARRESYAREWQDAANMMLQTLAT